MQTNLQAALLALSLDRSSTAPLHAQLTEALRALILDGTARPGERLPASRDLAAELSVSRQTTLTALDQLIAEGYLAARRGAGTFVARDLPHLSPPVQVPADGPRAEGPSALRVFQPGLPDMALFPHGTWARHLDRAWRSPDPGLLGNADPFGWPPLRAAIASHLGAWRGLDCSAGQVIVTSGSVETFETLFRALFAPGETVLIETPGYAPMRHAAMTAGLRHQPLPVDSGGAILPAEALARGAVVSPSRHYPLGVTMPLARRLALLDWARRQGTWIIEDDYDSEFRYTGTPLPALAALGPAQTIYVGSFSKLFSPTLRLGYMVVPQPLLDRVRAAMARTGPRASLVPQPALASFMESGEFAIHLRRMRRTYADRRAALRAAILRLLPGRVTLPDDPAGMHVVCHPGPDWGNRPDTDIAARARAHGLGLRALSAYWPDGDGPQGLVLGFAAFPPDRLAEGAATLARLFAQAEPGKAPVRT